MRVLYASIDERGHAHGGYAGDQSGKELKIAGYYSFGQNVVLRPVNRKVANHMVAVGKKIVESRLVGYDQYERTTLFKQMEKCDWDADKYIKSKVKTETDCSAFISVLVNSCGIKVSKDIWTGNMKQALLSTGQFKALTRPINTPSLLMKGDIVLNERSHVVLVVDSSDSDYPANQYGDTYETLARLNFRSAPSLKSKYIYAKIPKGTKIKGFLWGKTWLYIRYNGMWGYCRLKGKSKKYCQKL